MVQTSSGRRKMHVQKLLLLIVVGILDFAAFAEPYHLQDASDAHGGVKMGIPDHGCDDAKWNLQLDWNGSIEDFTCLDVRRWQSQLSPEKICDKIGKPLHICMKEAINYLADIPTSGPHRPLWPVYGEYRYLPPQRWVHSLEHGAVVFLYHPCTQHDEIMALKSLARTCLRRHIISPNVHLTKDQPMAILVYGCKLMLGTVLDQNAVVQAKDFIRNKALKAPESRVWRDGQFSAELIRNATILTDRYDTVICPSLEDLIQFHD